MKKLIQLSLLSLFGCISYSSYANDWSYSGDTSPEHWGQIKSAYSLCQTGKNQSPIDVNETIKGQLPELALHYKNAHAELINNNHGISVKLTKAGYLTLAHQRYYLNKLSFHSPSENTIDGQHYPMEVQFIHTSKTGQIAVISILFRQGKANRILSRLWRDLPMHEDEHVRPKHTFNPILLVPLNEAYLRFNGSMTTPPCQEGVTWMLMQAPNTISLDQIDKLNKSQKGQSNARPTQPLNARVVIQ
ncbi:carbonic anhydrase [Celerinatantimonas sp. MCCC 1A17872]|uniref:carbonic anhydrase n=1 Tax=Celerinatantimonas sp. MCCC 1A17872 TaxID=3177514 RepID=UPI0038C41E64